MNNQLPDKLSIIIPCYNEECAIEPVMERLQLASCEIVAHSPVNSVEVIVIDDCSTDSSNWRLQYHKEKCRVLRCPVRLGYGGAIKTGIAQAQGDLIAFYDMDSTYDPMDLIKMIQRLVDSEVDMVCGDRLSWIEGMPLTRQIGNRLFVNILRNIFFMRVNDCCTGLRVFRRSHAQSFINFLPNNLNFTLAMSVLFLVLKIPFVEVPIHYGKRIGQSKLRIWLDGPRFLLTIFGYWLRFMVSRKKLRLPASIAQPSLARKV